MKNLCWGLISLLFVPLTGIAQGMVNRSETKATAVTVYRQGARIFSEKRVEVPAGSSIIQFYGVSFEADPGSIQVSASGPVTIKSVNLEQDFIAAKEKKPEVINLEKIRKSLSSKITEHRNQMEVLDKEMQFLTVNMPQSGPASAAKLADIISAGQYFKKKNGEIISEKQWRKDSVQAITDRISQIDKQIAELSGDVNRPVTMAVVSVETKEKTTAVFNINYLVMSGGWYPSYDLRVKSIEEPIEITYRANVFQTTGVEWNQVKLRLSSANPMQSGHLPIIHPYRLDYIRMQPVVFGYGVQNKSLRIRGISKSEENVEMDMAASAPVPFVQTERQTVVEFEPMIPYTIPSNGNNYVVDIKTAEIPATYSYLAIPKIDPQVHLRARLTDWEQLHLLEGSANIFYEGAFTGKTYINPGNITDTLEISLGTDRAISVAREVDKDFTEKRFLSSRSEETKGWKITVRNNKRQKISLELIDQVPLSAQSDIEVTDIKTNGGKLNQETGEVKWSLDLAPSGRTEKKFTYTVRYPKGEKINIE